MTGSMQSGLRVLVVDDEPDIQEIVRWGLEHFGRMQVWCAGTGADALRIATDVRPDVILLDVVLPDMDGPSVVTLLRASDATASIPVIFVTGSVQPRDRRALQQDGVIGVFAKPFDPVALHERIRETLRSAA